MCKPTFEDVRDDLKKYWKPELNGGKLMGDFTTGSHKLVTLCCSNCNETMTRKVNNFAHRRKDRKFNIVRFPCKCNSLANTHPQLIPEWHKLKNGQLTPEDVIKTSHEKAWWICSEGHEFEAMIAHKTSKKPTGCPICSNRGSKGVKVITNWLRENNIQYLTEYYATSENFSVIYVHYDIYIPKEKIFVEIHGAQHFNEGTGYFKTDLKHRQKIDAEKQAYAEAHGHFIMVDYREHDPELALERFKIQFGNFINERIKHH